MSSYLTSLGTPACRKQECIGRISLEPSAVTQKYSTPMTFFIFTCAVKGTQNAFIWGILSETFAKIFSPTNIGEAIQFK